MGNTAIEQFERDKVVCPLQLKHNLFTVAAVDNIDVNPTSATAISSFHGTAVSLYPKITQVVQETFKVLYQRRKYYT